MQRCREEYRAAPPTVVVGDPDAVLRQSMTAALLRAEYRVLAQAESRDELLALGRKLRPNLVLTGQTSTEEEELEPLGELKRATGAALVLVAPIPTVERIRVARIASVDALLGRPPREGDLLAAVEMSLAKRAEIHRLRADLAGARERLESVTVVQKAKEVLMRQSNITDAEAFSRLRKQAERSGRPLKAVAEAVLLAAQIAPEGHEHALRAS